MGENKNILTNEETLRAIFNTAVDGMIIINDRGIIEAINQAVTKMFLFEEAELIGKNISVLMPEPDKSKHDGYIKNHLDTGEKKIIGIGREIEGKRKDGSVFPFFLSVSNVKLKNGTTVFAGVLHDISVLKKAQKDIEDYSKKLEKTNIELQALDKEKELSEMKSRFISMASHEFRTPLSTILSSVNLMAKYNEMNEKDKFKSHVVKVKSAIVNLTDILEFFLSVEKLDSGHYKIDAVEFDFIEFINSHIEEIRDLLKEKQRLVLQFNPNKIIVQHDKKIIRTVLQNLVTNAIKYSDEKGEIIINIQVENDTIIFKISDNGIGIPEEEQKYLFDRFYRAKNALNIQGTGIGLNIIKKYIELIGGNITFTSKINHGTTFIVSLPIISKK
jgi:PAS domain S-box-containing protein